MADKDDAFDVIVIGAGPVGMTVAGRAVRGGLTTAVVEKRLAGGECEYYACIPSKALLWPMELAAEVSRMPGLELRGPIDAAAVLARRDETVSRLDDRHQVTWVDNLPATFVRGHGRLAGPLRVEVSTPDGGPRPLQARHAVVVATGSDPAIPGVPGLREAQPWTNREATEVQQVPKRLAVIGAGPVACEMAQALHSLGAQETTVLVRRDRLLERAEPFAGEMVAASFQKSGIDVRFGARRPALSGRFRVARSPFTPTMARRSTPTNSSSAPAADRRSTTSAWRPSACKHTTRSRSTAACGPPRCPTAGSTPSATSTAATCSPTWASTRPASAAT
ncbi:oxidoreductase [Planosporangium mesophilum]|uniref:Oxidoreductase n=1 Tax=Planosporangium mesophilum TaxID=689768 RepID=A0A8J3TBE8_9ACTN|nr:oxidoreductase [Planosporangium mesophilum]